MALAPGTRLGPYEIVDQLGAGGMGVVYRARDARLERDVAIKVLPLGVLSDDSARSRFQREALALARLSHPHIATLFDVGQQDGESYLVMECVAGESLAARIASGPLPVRDVVALGAEIADALAEAHELGIVHRDLKPANVMVTPKGRAKVLDFGLVKLLAPSEASRHTATETRGAVGTLLYMSPEQALGLPVDHRTDVWSLGVLLYEALAGVPPFDGTGTLTILHAIAENDPVPLTSRRPDVPPALERIVARAMAKEPAARFGSASEMRGELSALLAQLGAPAPERRRPLATRTIGAAALVLGAAGVVGGISWHRSERRHWAREQAIPEIQRLQASDRALGAFLELGEALEYLPGDSQLVAMAKAFTDSIVITSSPPGAMVEIQDYGDSTGAWHRLGTTPLKQVAVPDGYFRWRVASPTLGSLLVAPQLRRRMHFALDSQQRAPVGMVYAPGRSWGNFIAFVGWVGPYELPSFYIDRYEVTNRDYQRFVDAAGYDRREYWTAPFVEGGRELGWSEAMARLRDSTGRPGPSTWKGGHYPEGMGDYPVQGVSWYEAAAYAAWAGKSLPTMAQWYYAAPPDVAALTVAASNISRYRVAPVGAFRGVGPFGTYDMAGNVKEWVSNPLDAERRLLLGGAWTSPSYLYSEPEALSAFDRGASNGFRCVRNPRPLPANALAAIHPLERDFTKVTPASDAVFHAYEVMYSYDRTSLDPRAEGVVHDGADWREERVSFNTAYGGRMSAYLFLPKNVRPPYQAVVFFPSARVLDLNDSRTLGDVSFFDFVVQSGRAVIYPVYQDTYERKVRSVLPGPSGELALVIDRYKDVARSIDYLATRPDIDTTKLAYLGVSMGAAEGVIYTTLLQQRLRADVFLDGGYFLGKPTPGQDQADFAPRLRIPVLMVNGRYDFSFSLDRAQNPLFRMLGTPAADKRHVLLDAPHDVRVRRPELVQAVLPWLDRYLGAVR